jgi:hypothetical protein
MELLALPLVVCRKNRTLLVYTYTWLFGTLNLSCGRGVIKVSPSNVKEAPYANYLHGAESFEN